ncbi:MAG TPA: ABC transporter permease [Acidimicrobiales bacterium]|nr:ABC transporter permease [Acidimicrobiales bacterium]
MTALAPVAGELAPADRRKRTGRAHRFLRGLLRTGVHLLAVMFFVSIGTFMLLEFVPGDPAVAVLGPDATPQQYDEVRAELGLDRPLPQRYADWLGDAVQGDFGSSLRPPVRDVSGIIMSRLPVTLEIAGLAIAMALAMAIPLALWSASQSGGPGDQAVSATAYGLISIPNFLAALILIFFFVFRPDLVRTFVFAAGLLIAVGMLARRVPRVRREHPEDRLRSMGAGVAGAVAVAGIAGLLFLSWPDFPRQGFVRWTDAPNKLDNLRSVFLPAFTLALIEAAIFFRVLRNDLVTTLQEDFVLAARARGMPRRHILLREALRPSSFSLVTVAGVSLGRLIGAAVIVEAVFRLPGLGSMMVDAVAANDFRVVQGGVLAISILYVLLNLTVDSLYKLLDPRIRRV